MRTKPAEFTRGMVMDKVIDVERLASQLRGIVDSMDLLKLDSIRITSSGAVDDGVKIAQRFVNTAHRGINEARQAKKLDPVGPESPEPGTKRRKKPTQCR